MAGNSGMFWDYIRVYDKATVGEDVERVDLKFVMLQAFGCPSVLLKTLQTNLWNGWMDKLRAAGAPATDAALSTISAPKQLWTPDLRPVDIQPC